MIESVSEKLDSTPPKSLTCDTQPLLIFQCKCTKVFQELHDNPGKKKVLDCLLVDVDFSNKDFVTLLLKQSSA